jgi:cob(I)alamin adenosyltransferase
VGGVLRIYTRRGDDGTTALRAGGRVRKDDPVVEVTGTVDEAQAALGLARAESEPGSELDGLLVRVERELWVLMAELSTADEEREALRPGVTSVTEEMVRALEGEIDAALGGLELAPAFAVPGENRLSASLDVARTVVRRAERLVAGLDLGASRVPAYLNRLSDLCWALARSHEQAHLVAGGPNALRRARMAP